MSEPLLQASGLVRRYGRAASWWRKGSEHLALDQVAVTVSAGETVAIVGESGSGKSTLARILLGLDRPDAGEVLLDGQPIATLPRKQVAALVQPVFQDPYGSLNPSSTVENLLALPLRLRGQHAGRREAVRSLLDQVGLPERTLDAYPRALSGGQRQRVAIARALAMQPKLLICDEPTSALDVSVQAQILNLLKDLQQELKLTMLFISHDLPVIRQMCDRIGVMQHGHLVEVAETEKLFTNAEHEYSRKLISLMPEFKGMSREGLEIAS